MKPMAKPAAQPMTKNVQTPWLDEYRTYISNLELLTLDTGDISNTGTQHGLSHCHDCGGRCEPGGSVLVLVPVVHGRGIRVLLCEHCFLIRLGHRATILNLGTSGYTHRRLHNAIRYVLEHWED